MTAKNAKGWFANTYNADKIAKWVDDNNQRSSLQVDDLILSTRGTVGCCAIVDIDVLPANIDQDVARISLESDLIYPTVVLTYINSKYGQDWILRNQTGMVQQGLSLLKVREMPIPVFSETFQKRIDNLIRLSKSKFADSKVHYNNAQDLLKEELGINNLTFSNVFNILPGKAKIGINEKSFKESFLETGRLDAEYYQPKYEKYLNVIYNYYMGYEKLEVSCDLKDDNFKPLDDKQYKYIELSNIGRTGEILGCTIADGSLLPTRARRIINKNDVIVSSIEGSLSSCALVPDEYDNSLCSTGFYVVRSGKINSETLLILFKSELMQNVLKKACSGTILTAINKSEFLNVPIPLINIKVQNEIQLEITENRMLRKQHLELIEIAKQAVEIAIEESEDAAINFLNASI